MKDLKEKTIRGGLARLCAQGADFTLRLLSLMVMARLLGPKDFGLVGMVTAFTGVLILFRDFGLSAAAIQRPIVTEEQKSTLFWINVLFGAGLVLLTMAMAPLIAAFYHEPRLVGVAFALAGSFLFNAAGIQHGVLLQRQMRFTALAVVEHHQSNHQYFRWYWRRHGRLRILGLGSDDADSAIPHHDWILAGNGLDSRTAAQRSWNTLDDALRRHCHFEWPGHIYRQQF